MTKPAVIIGLGGTGLKVITWLKHDLLLSNNGRMPDNIKLLEIDTATKLKSEATSIEFEEKRLITGQEEASMGGVTLGPDEFIYIGGEVSPLTEDIKNRNHPQIGWFRAERWLNDLPPAAFTLNNGAGRLRQFGRLSVFKDILGQETHTRIWRAFRTSIEAVRMTTDEEHKLEIMIVGSFEGGADSGMFIDVAFILRMLAQQLGVHHVLRGFFAIPSAFTTTPDSEMKIRTFAAWRDLNLFAEAKCGVFPVIAESISAMLNEKIDKS